MNASGLRRDAVVAGQFYPGEPLALEKEMEILCQKKAKKADYKAAVLPHAGYVYSGAVAGHTISRANLDAVETFIILGPNHTGLGSSFSIYPGGRWITPLGEANIDIELKGLILASSPLFEEDEDAHSREHSIEVEVPFVQFIKGRRFGMVAIVVSHNGVDTYIQAGRSLAEAISKYGRRVFIIASSDMTHYESYDSAYRKDHSAIEEIRKLDERGLARVLRDKNITMCGYGPVMTAMACCKAMGSKRAQLVEYKTSAEASGDYGSVVGYAGILIP